MRWDPAVYGRWMARIPGVRQLRLGSDDSAEFEVEYAAALREAYPRDPAGLTLFPFRRIFAVAHKLMVP